MPVPFGGLLPSGRPISFGTLQAEWDGVVPITMSEYYVQGGVASATSTISMANFYGKSATTLPSGTVYYGGAEGEVSIVTAPTNFPTNTGYTGYINLSRNGPSNAAGVRSDGTLWAWGANTQGQLGKGNTVAVYSPTQVGTLTTWRYASIGSRYADGIFAAIKTDNTLWTCGDNNAGQLGDNSTISRSSLVQVAGAWSYVNINHSVELMFGIKTAGTLWHWGSRSSSSGVAGQGTSYMPSTNSPVQIGTATNWKHLESKFYSVVAVKYDGTLWAWGESGSTPHALGHQGAPLQVGTDTDWWKVGQGCWHGFGIKHDGRMFAWGRNEYGSCGTGTAPNTYIYSPTPVKPEGQYWRHVSAGFYSSIAINMNGTVWGCGLQGTDYFQKGYLPVPVDEYRAVSQWTQIGSSSTWKWVSSYDGVHGILG